MADALEHPYFSALHEPEDEPSCHEIFQFEFEDKSMIWNVLESCSRSRWRTTKGPYIPRGRSLPSRDRVCNYTMYNHGVEV